MATIWDDSARAALVSRAQRLTPNHTARWGRFTATAMLAHVNDAMRMATGDLVVDPSTKTPTFLRWPLVRYLFIHVLPMPKGAPTAPALLERSASADMAQEQHAFQTLIDALPRYDRLAASHPAFGSLTRDDWGALIHKHVDHHLRQFGV